MNAPDDSQDYIVSLNVLDMNGNPTGEYVEIDITEDGRIISVPAPEARDE